MLFRSVFAQKVVLRIGDDDGGMGLVEAGRAGLRGRCQEERQCKDAGDEALVHALVHDDGVLSQEE